MEDKIIQIASSSFVGGDGTNYTIVYGLSVSGKVYHLSENHDKWVFKSGSPLLDDPS